MADFDFGFDIGTSQARTAYQTLPEGYYLVEVFDANLDEWASGKKFIEFTFTVIREGVGEPSTIGAKVKHRLTLPSGPKDNETEDESKRRSIHQEITGAFVKALLPNAKGKKLSTDALIGKKGMAQMGTRTWETEDGQERESNEVRGMYPADQFRGSKKNGVKEEAKADSPTESFNDEVEIDM